MADLADKVTDRKGTATRVLPLLVIFTIALVLRGAWVAHVRGDFDTVMDGDGRDYLDIATNVYRGHGVAQTVPSESSAAPTAVLTARRPPLYPLFAAGLFRLAGVEPSSGQPYLSVLVAQAVLDALTVLLVYLLARDFAGPKGGLVGAAGYALNFYVIQYTGQFMAETLFTFLLTAALVALGAKARAEPPASWRWALGGLLLGLATLTRPIVLLFPLLASAWLLFRFRRDWRKAALPSALAIGAFAAALLPWSVRNQIQMEKLVLVSTVGGQTFYHSNHSGSNGQWVPLPVPAEAQGLSEGERDSYYYREGLRFIARHPFLSLRNAIKKVLRLYYVFYPGYDLFFGITFLLAVPGLWLYWKEGGANWLPALLILYTTLLCALFWGQPRFRAPILPCFLVFASYYVAKRIWTQEQGASHRRHVVYLIGVTGANLLVALCAQPVRSMLKALIG